MSTHSRASNNNAVNDEEEEKDGTDEETQLAEDEPQPASFRSNPAADPPAVHPDCRNSSINGAVQLGSHPPLRQSLCFTFPHGDASVLPTILTFMANFATLQAFPALNLVGEFNFMCYQLTFQYNDPYNELFRYDSLCSPLYLNSELYWNDVNDNDWAGALKTAALFGIVAGIMGFVAFALLASASCFELSPKTVRSVLYLQLVSAFCTILSLVGGAANVCKAKQTNPNESCSTDKVRIDTGAGFMLFSFFLFVAAGVSTYPYDQLVRGIHQASLSRGNRRATLGSPQETRSLTQAATPIQTLGGFTETRTILPGGETRIEREYLDESGRLVSEVTVQQQGVPSAQSTDQDIGQSST